MMEVELVYAKDIIPKLDCIFKPGVYYYVGYIRDWRNHLMDVWGETKCVGLRKVIPNFNVLAHSEDMWFTSRESAIKWANDAHFKIINIDGFN